MRTEKTLLRFRPDCEEEDPEESPVSGIREQSPGLMDILRTPLPSALSLRFAKSISFAVLLTLGTIVLLVMYKTLQCCLGFIISGYFVYMALSLKEDYVHGEIEERSALCTSVNPMPARKSCRVVFRTGGDVPEYYQFVVSGDKQYLSGLQPNVVYAIYFKKRDPANLLGFTQL